MFEGSAETGSTTDDVLKDRIHLLSSKGDGTLQGWSPIIGIVTAIVGNILISFALNIQRYAHIRLSRESERAESLRVLHDDGSHVSSNHSTSPSPRRVPSQSPHGSLRAPTENDPLMGSEDSSRSQSTVRNFARGEKSTTDASPKTYLKSPYWWLGITLMTVGEAGNFLAYGFAPASIVSPLGVVALVSNCIIAPIMLKERFRQRDFWGVLIAIAGAVTVVLSARSSETKLGPHEIWHLITRWEFETYLGITIALMLCGMWASQKYGGRSILIDLGLVGLFGGYTALSTKGVSSLLSYRLWRVFTFPITYLLIFVLVSTALLQIKYLNRALQRFDSTQVIPIQFVIFTISVIVGSAILYQDFKSATAKQLGEFLGGCLLTFSGVYLITSGRKRGNEAEPGTTHDVDSEEANVGLSAEPSDSQVPQDKPSRNAKIDVRSRRRSGVAKTNNDSPNRTPTGSLGRLSSGLGTPRILHSDSNARTSFSFSSNEGSRESQNSISTDESPLIDNPWQDDERLRPFAQPHQGAHGTQSSPIPQVRSQSNELDVETPRRSSRPDAKTPTKGDRPSILSKRSMSRMIPGPFSSPLSSSLSAVVADLRNGADLSPAQRSRAAAILDTSNRSPRPKLRMSESEYRSGGTPGASQDSLGGSSSSARVELPTREGIDGWRGVQRPGPSSQGRARSLSSSIGDLFHSNRSKKSSGDGEPGT
ncbi:MAG: hypothetical protein M4579_000292 [Chaenotheca gracillima]|nr:MAG: hypothetical protein M4579_000292 [Chaenotheca gracillima]